MSALRPVMVRHRQPFSHELYVEGIEIKLEIACDLHLAPGQARCDPFRRAFQEAALGDIEHRPHQQDRSQHHAQRVTDRPQHAAPFMMSGGLPGWGTKPVYHGRITEQAGRRSAPFLGREESASFRSEEHTSELQSLMRISYAVYCVNKKSTTQS